MLSTSAPMVGVGYRSGPMIRNVAGSSSAICANARSASRRCRRGKAWPTHRKVHAGDAATLVRGVSTANGLTTIRSGAMPCSVRWPADDSERVITRVARLRAQPSENTR